MTNRRVGTFTLGISLILTGVLSLLSLFTSFINIVFMLKLSPLILVFLGIELLIYAAFNKDEKLKYDGLAIFICFILIVGTLAAVSGVVVFEELVKQGRICI